MESYVVLAQKNVRFHGIWQAQYKISDSLMRTIATSMSSTPSRACKLVLTSAGLSLILLPSADGKTGRTDQVPFTSLRDIIPNQYNPKCLVIIYVNDTNKFSVMACTSDDENDLNIVSKAYKNRKNILQQERAQTANNESINWTKREQRTTPDGHQTLVQEKHRTTSTSNGVIPGIKTNGAVMSSESYGSSQKSDLGYSSRNFSSSSDNADTDDVFLNSRPVIVHEPEDMIREPVTHKESTASFNVGIQTFPSEGDSDTESIKSVSSIQALRNDMNTLTEEMKAIKFILERSTGISAEEYYKRGEHYGNSPNGHLPAGHPVSKTEHGAESQVRFSEGNNRFHELVPAGDNSDDYDIRSIGMQTLESSKNVRRYAKKPVTAATSNAYKEKIAVLKKRSASADGRGTQIADTGSVVNSHMSSSILGSSARSYASSTVSQQRSVIGSSTGVTRPVKRNLSTGSTTIIKPIESVYPGGLPRRSNSGKGHRVIVYTPKKQYHM